MMTRIFAIIFTLLQLAGCTPATKLSDESVTQQLLEAAKENDYEKADMVIAEFVSQHSESTPEELIDAINEIHNDMQSLDKSDAITLSVFMQSEQYYSLPSIIRFQDLERKAYSQGSPDDSLSQTDDKTLIEPELIVPDVIDENNTSFDLPEPTY